jgi:hypothetical protein
VRGQADWCTLCYADLRPAPPEPLVLAPADAETAAAVGAGKHARREATYAPAAAVAVDGDGAATGDETAARLNADAMLALLAAESGSPLGSLGGLGGRLDNKGTQLALMAGGLLVVALLFLALMALAGLLV